MLIDVLIVGQGLAGSLLAWELMRQQMRVMVVDTGGENASKVAAGLMNPVTGQRLVKSPEIEHLLPVALDCYQQCAAAFKQDFFVPLQMLRILKNARERQYAQQRLQQAEYRSFLCECPDVPAALITGFGVLQQQQTGYLKTRLLLKKLQEFFIANASYRQTTLDYQDIALKPCLSWHDIQPQHIVFCEGHHGRQNPWFGSLPFQPAKGEILSCRTHAHCPNLILNFGCWIIPHQPNHFRIGATFESGQTDTTPTEQAKKKLLQALSGIYPGLEPIEVLAHQAGIRPTTLDKQPFIGSHPRQTNLHIFNGFGAKGSLSIPWYARQFVSALNQQTTCSSNGHIQRYYETHFPV